MNIKYLLFALLITLSACKEESQVPEIVDLTEFGLDFISENSVLNQHWAPFWIKSVDGTILWINESYKRNLLHPLGLRYDQMVGTKGEILGDKFCKKILANDRIVLYTESMMLFEESIPGIGKGISYKEPIYDHSGVLIGTMGHWIINREDMKNLIKLYESN